MGNLSPEEQKEVEKDAREEFDKLDTDKSGMLDKNELRALLVKFNEKMGKGEPLKEETVDEVFKEFDKDNSGKISFDEIMAEWPSFCFIVGLSKDY